MKRLTICILGGSGFVGRHLSVELSNRGHFVKILTRRRERHRELLVLPNTQIIEADVHDEAQLNEQFKNCDVVVNLVGILNEKGFNGKGFQFVHVELAHKVITACISCKVPRLLHMSALNANPDEKSFYLRTKGEAENYVHNFATNKINVTSFRPSVIFGPEDDFLNRFASILKITPWFFPLACADAKFAPVYVGDVVKMMADSLDDPNSADKRLKLCGPKQYSLKQLVQYVAATCGYRRVVFGLPDFLSRLQAKVLERFPGKPFSMDNYHSLQKDSICNGENFCQTSLESIAPKYLKNKSSKSSFYKYRTKHNH